MDFRHYDPEKLKKLRDEAGLTQKELAEIIGVNRQTVFRAEAGRAASYELLCSMCHIYDADVVSLLYRRPLEAEAA